MYVVLVLLLMIVAPAGGALGEKFVMHGAEPLIAYAGKWFVFWAGGVRLLLAGARLAFRPAWTMKTFFKLEDPAAKPLVQDLGFAVVAIGALCIMTLIEPRLLVAAAIVSGLYFGLAGLQLAMRDQRVPRQNLVMLTDVIVAAVLAAFVAMTVRGG